MAGNQRQNAGPPEVEWLATGSRVPGHRNRMPGSGNRIVGFGNRKARNFGVCALLLFVLLPGPPCGRGPTCWRPPCRREQSCRVRGFTYRLGRDVADCLCQLPVPTAYANLQPACADCVCQPAGGPPGRTRPGAVSRTCTGRRARWLGILPFRVCRRGLRCCGFSPLRGARILSCLSQGT